MDDACLCRLLSILQKISQVFPFYDDVAALCENSCTNSLRLKKHVEQVCEDLLEFFQSVAKNFSGSSGRKQNMTNRIKTILQLFISMRKRPAVVWDLIWTPIDVRFKDLLQQFNQHAQFVSEELTLFHTKKTISADSAAELERQRAADERRFANESRRKIDEVSTAVQEHLKSMYHTLISFLLLLFTYTMQRETV